MSANTRQDLNRLQKWLFFAGLIVLAICLIAVYFDASQFYQSYLFAYTFWLGVTLGSMTIALIHQLTGGMWGIALEPFLKASMRTLPLLAVLFLPILLGLHNLYHWSHADAVAHDPVLQNKRAYLNVPFFIGRAAFYFAVWFLIIHFLNRWTERHAATDDPVLAVRLQKLSGVSLVLYAFTMTFAAFDWLMSLNPHWFSTIYGMIVISGQILTAFAMSITLATLAVGYAPFEGHITANQFWDLGKLLLAFVMIWAYLSFSQLLITWSGNLTEEIPWYLTRLKTSWQILGVLLIVLHFALPFVLLLSRELKKNRKLLGAVAVGILIMRLIDLFWLIAPEHHHEGFKIHFLDLLLPVGLGGFWLAYFLNHLKNHLLPETKEAR